MAQIIHDIQNQQYHTKMLLYKLYFIHHKQTLTTTVERIQRPELFQASESALSYTFKIHPALSRPPFFHWSRPDMIFVQNFTLLDFHSKNFTPQKCVICEIFSRELTALMHQISTICAFFGYK